MTKHTTPLRIGSVILLSCLASMSAQAATTDVLAGALGTRTDLSTAPLVTGSTITVKPNVMFVLDDSGSMDWDYLPDWANSNNPPVDLTRNNGFNGVAYSAAITYAIPIDYNNNTASITVGGTSTVNATVTSITVNGSEILSGVTTGSKTTATVATSIATKINACKTAITGACTIAGYSAAASGSKVTITAPTSLGPMTFSPIVTKGTGTLTYSVVSFSGTSGGSLFTSMSGTTTASGGDATATTAAPNWRSVPDDGYGVQRTTKSNLEGTASFYTFVGGEYCTEPHFRSCQATQDATHTYLAQLRWCNSTLLTNCQATWSATYSNPRYAGEILTGTQATSALTIGGSGSTSINQISVSGFNIMSAPTLANTVTSNVALATANAINTCTASIIGACTVSGYSATVAGSVVTIKAPLGIVTATPVVTKTGTMTAGTVAFAGGSTGTKVSGANVLTYLDPATANYAYPGTTIAASTRTDCAGTTCTYAEEMTNYANWWAYYHTRMQMMKSSVSISFSSLDQNYRVGYATINNNTSTDFINPTDFDLTNKGTWYTKLFTAKPNNSTPLRVMLANIGRLYAGKLNGTNFNGVAVVEPLQYSCQQNYTLLSTDGYWNESSNPMQINGTSAIGNQDGTDVPPYSDGATVVYDLSTAQIQQSQSQVVQSTNQRISRDQQIQKSTSTLQAQTSQLQQDSGTLQTQTTQLQTQTSQLQISTSPLLANTSQLYSSTSQLQISTSQLLASTSQLQASVSPLLASTSQLLADTSQLQRQTATLLKETATLQSQTATLLASTSTLQGTLSKVLMTCAGSTAFCGTAPATGVANAKWTVVTSGTCVTSPTTQCSIVSGLSAVSNVATSCNTAATLTAAAPQMLITVTGTTAPGTQITSLMIDGIETILTPSVTSNTNAGVAANVAAAIGANGFTATAVGATIFVSGPSITTASVISAIGGFGPSLFSYYVSVTDTLANADSNGKIYSSCAYSATAAAPVASCTYSNPSATPNNTTILTATQCSYSALTAPTAAASCTYTNLTTATTDGTVYQAAPKICSYSAWTAPTAAASCTYKNQTTVTTDGTVWSTAPTRCTYSAWTAVANAASCTYNSMTTATTDGTVYQAAPALCSYAASSGPLPAASCTYNTKTTATADGTVYQPAAAICSYGAWTAPAPAGSCTYLNQTTAITNGTVYQAAPKQCSYGAWPVPSNVASCTYNATQTVATTDGTVYATAPTICSYAAWTAPAPAASCTYQNQTTAITNGTVYQAAPMQCSYDVWTAPVNTASCTYNATQTTATTNGTVYYAAPTKCSYTAWSAPAVAASCTYQNQTTATANGTFYQAAPKQCSYGAWSGALPAASCTYNTQTTATADGTVYQAAPAICSYAPWSAFSNTSSCTTASQTTAITNGTVYQPTPTQCQYTPWSAWSGTPSCTTVAKSAGPSNYTVGTAANCQSVIASPFTNTAVACTPTTIPDLGGNTTQCQYVFTTVGTPACSAPAYVAGNFTNPAVYKNCQTVVTSPYANAASCAANAVPDASGFTTQCQYTPWTAYANAATCTAVPQAFAALTSVQCQTTDTGWVGVASCTASGTPEATYATFDAAGHLKNCDNVITTSVPVASCTASAPVAANANVTTTCATNQIQAPTGVSSCAPVAPNAGNTFISTICTPVTTGPTSVNSCTPALATATNNWTSTTCGPPVITAGGVSNTLADVAEYYYKTDLRTATLGNCTSALGGTNVLCTTPDPGLTDLLNNVPKSGSDAATWQHMTTYTLGLGASGYMLYSPSYATDPSGDYFDIKNGTSYNAAAGNCLWQTSGNCTWPTPSSNSQANIDDLWHAAVNGRGTYFSASNPTSLSTSLTTALASVKARTGTSAAATTSNPNVTPGDNFLFSSTFVTVDWVGEIIRQQLDLTTGKPVVDALGNPVIDWTAQADLDVRAYTSRTIYMADPSNLFNGTAANKLKAFTYTNLDATEVGYFSKTYLSTSAPTPLSQFCAVGANCLTAASQTAAAGAPLVNFLRGETVNEGVLADITKYFRLRPHVLGDIVNAEAVYVKGSLLHFADANYSTFAGNVATRQGLVYAAANDGMLHAFYAADGLMDPVTGQVVATGGTAVIGGEEAWAYIPSFVLPNLYALADKNYSTQHHFYVDGTPTRADICPTAPTTACTASQWRTIMVGGLNKGGRGYYALDITNPAKPALLWEFSDANMGYTYGNPEVAKLADGTWVVFVTSGYNNIPPYAPTGDGKGYLYVLNAFTGQLVTSVNGTGIIGTGAGSTTAPSGLARIIAQVVNSDADNTTLQVYGGDLEGNVWRFDVNGNVGAAGFDAQLLITLKSATGVAQPVTTKPQVGIVSGHTMVYVGTGRYLGDGDLGDTRSNTIYGIKDPLSLGTVPATAIYPDRSSFVQQVQTTTTCPANATGICTLGQLIRTSTKNPVDLATAGGWYVDLPDAGERINTDPTLALGTLGFTANVPSSSSCSTGGYSYSYFLDYRTGGPVSSSYIPVTNVLGQTTYIYVSSTKLGDSLGTRPIMVRLPSGTVVECVRMSDGTTNCGAVPIDKGIAPTRRVSWRELIQ